ncbi:MAG TPA: hypothetical protein CFH82_07430 [Sulfurospirillum sp. UBA12182]|nr:MAG TPA: hypothetical protein CFH82_07430 [Sulfurospirillum sp. UBA12182]
MLHRLITSFAKRRVIKKLIKNEVALESFSNERFNNLLWLESEIILLNCKASLVVFGLIGLGTLFFIF